jgi:hypothetical protein
MDQHRIDLVLGAVAIDRGSRSHCDHRSHAACERSPREPVDERILERLKRSGSVPRKLEEPGRIVAA